MWVVSLVYGGYLFGNMPIIHENLGVILIVGIGAVLGPLLLRRLLRLMRRGASSRRQVSGFQVEDFCERRILREVALDAGQDCARHLVLILIVAQSFSSSGLLMNAVSTRIDGISGAFSTQTRPARLSACAAG